MRINHNIMAMNTNRQLGIANSAQSKSMEKLSSGLRINSAADDAAGLAISEKMRGQIRGLDQASSNAQDGISMIQTAEGALNETHDILQRMRELAVQSSNDTNVGTDRDAIQEELDALATEVTAIATRTEFNTQKLLNGNLGGSVDQNTGNTTALAVAGVGTIQTSGAAAGTYSITATAAGTMVISSTAGTTVTLTSIGTGAQTINLGEFGITISTNANFGGATALNSKAVDILTGSATFQIGANKGQHLSLAIDDMRASALGVGSLDVTTQSNANNAIDTINTAINTVSTQRSKLGAVQNRLEHTIKNLDTSYENLQASESRIRDVDMAKEMMEYTKNNILSQAAQSMLAQANQAPQGVLQLLR